MSQMNTTPVLSCKRCGELLVVSHLSTSESDPEGQILFSFMANLGKIALCPFCRQQRDWYIMQGRGEDWEKGLA